MRVSPGIMLLGLVLLSCSGASSSVSQLGQTQCSADGTCQRETTPCADPCTAGATRCAGALVQSCAADGDGCLVWAEAVACADGATCNPSWNSCEGRLVMLSWRPNRESGVNRAGGGYRVSIGGRTPIDVPYVSGALAPTSAKMRLPTGTYTAEVVAYARLDSLGGSSGTTSEPSASLTVVVP